MAKSNAERQKLYRANLSKDRVKFDKSKQKSRERDNARRKHLQGDSLEQFRARQKRAAKKYRDGLKLKRLNDKESSTYKTRQSFGKAVKRVEHALPKDTNKRVVIVRHLAESLDIVPKVTNKHERQQRQLSATLKEAIVEFYGRDDISYQMPVKRDYISVKDDDGEKLTLQKRILLNTVRETYELFLSDNNITHSSLSLNSFGNLRPLNVLLNSHMSHCSCVCSYHENINLLLNDNFNIKIRNNVVDPTKQIQWSQWVSSNGYMNKQEFHDTIEKCLITLKKQLPSFFIHVFIKRKQSAHFEALKLESNDESIIIQVDYSENFKIDIRDAVQGYFYTSSVVSLFTCYVWHSNGGFSLVFISNNLSHDKYCIGATLDNLFNKLKVKCQYLKEVHMFSDGATQQFNQKFLFRNLCRFAEKFKVCVKSSFRKCYAVLFFNDFRSKYPGIFLLLLMDKELSMELEVH